MRYAGIDYGTKRVGVALSDPEGRIAFPKKVFENSPSLVAELVRFLKEEGVEGVVLGESLASDGRENELMADVRRMAEALAKEAALPIFFEKEFFTSVEARRHQEHAAKSGARAPDRPSGESRIRKVDDSAAALILQRYLDRKNQHSATNN